MSLIYEKMILPQDTCHLMIRALVQMKYHMQTLHGISEGVSQKDDEGALFGIGQGATDAPAGWLLVSTILSKMYDMQAHGCNVLDPFKKLLVHWSHVMFVDDT